MIVAWTLLALGVWVGNGAIWGLPFVLAASAWLIHLWRRGDQLPSRRTVAVALLFTLAASLIREPAIYLSPGTPRWAFAVAAVALGALVLNGVLSARAAPRTVLAGALAIYALTGAAVIARSPAPKIDVFILEKEGARALFAGRNPYAITYPNPYDAADTRAFFGDDRTELRDYPYPPLSLYVTAAGEALGDPRIALLAAQLLCALFLWLIARRVGQPAWLALALAGAWLMHPRGPFVLEQAWSESLPACAFLALTYALVCEWTPGVVIALAAFLAFKQYGVLVLPLVFAARLRAASLSRVAVACVLAVVVTLPLYLRDPTPFVDDVLLFQLRQPFRMDALSLPALVASLSGLQAPGALAPVAAAAVMALCWRRLRGSPHRFAFAAALVYGAFFLFAKQAFCNYYYLDGALLLAAGATLPPDNGG